MKYTNLSAGTKERKKKKNEEKWKKGQAMNKVRWKERKK